MPRNLVYLSRPINGTVNDDNIIADFAAADALFELKHYPYQDVQWYWDRKVHGNEGSDHILRDRPGDYKNGPLNGNVEIYGFRNWGGTEPAQDRDTVSYQQYGGGLDIELQSAKGYGTAKANFISGVEIFGEDRLYQIENVTGSQGHDKIIGDNGANVLRGLAGNDDLRGENGNDTLYGDTGNDTLRGGEGNDKLYGGDQNDQLFGNEGNDTIEGGSGNDSLYGNDNNDLLKGGSGRNELSGGNGNDTLHVEGSGGIGRGGAGNDTVNGGDGADLLQGDEGHDRLYGGNGNDSVEGGTGSDQLYGGGGRDRATWTGFDNVTLTLDQNGNGTARQGADVDRLYSIEEIVTAYGHDSIIAGSANEWMQTGAGNDTVSAGSGNDSVDGGNGDDSLFGDWGNDRLYGRNGDDTLDGGRNNDTIWGDDGDDLIIGGQGVDVLYGGSGADGFVFREGDIGTDEIHGFVIGQDWLSINDLLMDPVQMGESYVGKVYAFWADYGDSTVIMAKTSNTFTAVAKLIGYDDPNVVADAIYDGSLFTGPLPNDGGPGGFA